MVLDVLDATLVCVLLHNTSTNVLQMLLFVESQATMISARIVAGDQRSNLYSLSVLYMGFYCIQSTHKCYFAVK